jgi:hypothetical protein
MEVTPCRQTSALRRAVDHGVDHAQHHGDDDVEQREHPVLGAAGAAGEGGVFF